MNEVLSSTLESVPAPPAQPGARLAAARENCGFGIADVARQLKLTPSQVEALEAGDYQRLPGTVFVRGFIRNYARLVSLDPAPLLAGAGRQASLPATPEPVFPRSVNIPFPNRREFRWHYYAIALLLLLVPLVVFEFYSDDANEITVKSRQVALPQPEIVGGENVAEAVAVPQVPVPEDAAAATVRPMATVQAGTDAEDKSKIRSGTAKIERPPREHLLKLRFERESWVEIRDRNGRRIASQLNPAGSELAVSGLPPLSLVVGNALGVRLTHNDQPVNLAPHIKVDVARLTLE